MIQREKNLVILAAGIGSRFKGGIKQLQSVGPAGECIMTFSVETQSVRNALAQMTEQGAYPSPLFR